MWGVHSAQKELDLAKKEAYLAVKGQGFAKKGVNIAETGVNFAKIGQRFAEKGLDFAKKKTCLAEKGDRFAKKRTLQKPYPACITSTFTILPDLAHSPIVKELVMPTLFCLPVNMESQPKY